MKKKSRQWIAEWADPAVAQDALDSDARQRAEIRRLTKALRLAERYVPSGPNLRIVRDALDLKRKTAALKQIHDTTEDLRAHEIARDALKNRRKS